MMNPRSLFFLPALLVSLWGCGGENQEAQAGTSATPAAGESVGGDASLTSARRVGSSEPIGSAVSDTPSSRSRVEFEIADSDLGILYQEEETEIRFPFVIDGPDPVTITALDPSCGCSEVHLEVEGEVYPLNTPIKAGAKGAVVGTFNSANYLNTKTSTIRLLGNATNLPLALNLKAFIRRHFEISPSAVRFGQLLTRDLQQQTVSRKVKITAREAFEITDWKQVPVGIQVQEVEGSAVTLDDGRQSKEFEITLTGDMPAGALMRAVQASTSLGKDLEIHVTASVVGPVRYLPEEFLKFGAVEKGTVAKRQFKILATDPSFQLPTPQLEFLGPDHFQYKLVEKDPGKEWVVRFELSADTPIGRHGGRLRISYPAEAQLPSREIKVSAMVRSSQ